jgi:hypothetical protein
MSLATGVRSCSLYYDGSRRGTHDWREVVFLALAEHLRSKNYAIRVQPCASFRVERCFGLLRRDLPLWDSVAVLQDDHRGTFHVLDCHDFDELGKTAPLVHDRRCRGVLKCQYSARSIRSSRHRILRPWTYFESHWPKLQPRLQHYRDRPRSLDRLFFRGLLWESRAPVLALLANREIVNPSPDRIEFGAYLDEMCGHRILLSLAGMGELCHRDIEGFGCGTPVLRPRLRIEMHEPLVPDYHYISVEGHHQRDTPEVMAMRIEARFKEVIGKRDFLAAVAANAMQWYDRNVRLPDSMELTARLLGYA